MLHHQDLHLILFGSNDQDQEKLTKMLQDLCVGRISCIDTLEALTAIEEDSKKMLLVISDETPLGSTEQALYSLRSEKVPKNLPIILHTHKQSPAYVRKMVSHGVNGILQEPLQRNALNAILRNYLRSRNTKEVTKLVKNADFFADFTIEELKQLSSVAICRYFPAGETIISLEDPPDRFFVLLQGQVEVLIINIRSRLQLTINAGNCFGEMGALNNLPRSAYCIAANDCYALEIGSHILSDKTYPLRSKIISQMAFILARRIHTMNELLHRECNLEEKLEEPTTIRLPQSLSDSPTEKNKTSSFKTDKQAKEKALDSNKEKEAKEKLDNPFANPTAQADEIDETIPNQEAYDVLLRKVNLRSEFILNKIPKTVCNMIANKMNGYWTGSKLATINPHIFWSPKKFIDGTPNLKRCLHLVVLCNEGDEAYRKCYLGLPFTHRAIGLSQVGCIGSFLGNPDAIHRYFDKQPLKRAIAKDLEMPIDRLSKTKERIEFLTHTAKDVRDDTLFLVFDSTNGKNTALVREYFPNHQIVTIVKDYEWNSEEPQSLFTRPIEDLHKDEHIVEKNQFEGTGFYVGETFFLPDFSRYFKNCDALASQGYIFGSIGIFAKIGPDYSGACWGSKGGAEGAVKAARARFGISGAKSAQDLADAINWADG